MYSDLTFWSFRLTASTAVVAATLVACTASTFTDDEKGTSQLRQPMRCRTCGGPEPEPEAPEEPRQGPTIECGDSLHIVVDGLCYTYGCPQHAQKTATDGGGGCTGYSAIGQVGCPAAYPVQRCAWNGKCVCWTS